MTADQWGGLVGLLAFLISGFAVIPLDRHLDRRRRDRRRMQARRVR